VAAESGGGLDNFNASDAVLTNCTFTANAADRGGAIANDGSSPVIYNAVLWGDAAAGAGDEIHNGAASVPLVGYSDVAGSGGSDDWDAGLGTDGGGNVDADPRFADAEGPDGVPGTADDDLRLDGGSPAVDAGSSEDVPRDAADLDGDGDVEEPTPFDLDGLPRFIDDPGAEDTGRGPAPVVDMGAYERSAGRSCPADLDGDGHVGGRDLALLVGAWGPCGGCREDLDESGAVDLHDLLDLLHAWGPCGGDARGPARMSRSERRTIRKAIRSSVERKRVRRKVERRLEAARPR